MTDYNTKEPLTEMFIFETLQLLEQLEQSMLNSEKEKCFSDNTINEVFRIMHTIKGSAAMMMLNSIEALAHTVEDIFYYLREDKPQNIDSSLFYDLVFESVDFINIEIEKIKNGIVPDGCADHLINSLKQNLTILKQNNCKGASPVPPKKDQTCPSLFYEEDKKNIENGKFFESIIHFEDDCEMVNVRAYAIAFKLQEIADRIRYQPEDIVENTNSCEIIRREGFKISFRSEFTYNELMEFFQQTLYLKEIELEETQEQKLQSERLRNTYSAETSGDGEKVKEAEVKKAEDKKVEVKQEEGNRNISVNKQNMISVSVVKLDKLMDLVGEMVISEAMVIQNPDLKGLELNNFKKSAIQLNKITNELQDIVMSLRMVSLSATFHKMNRIVRDMGKKLEREVRLEIIGEETEVDKNIIEHISDPLMHLVRNAVDHGIESAEERRNQGKPETGTVTLEAKNSGSDVIIIVRDDGRGLNRESILNKARESNLIQEKAELNDRDIAGLILLPGFSTNETVTEFSGRGVGMDVVAKNLEAIGGSLIVESTEGNGTVFTIKIPLTLAIIDGMNIKAGNTYYTIPTISIKEFFRPEEGHIITDTNGNEMILVREKCFRLLRLNELYQVNSHSLENKNGIIIMVEQAEKSICIMADELLGQQQVVIKALPEYIQKLKNIRGIAGCTLLGDGSISLTLDVAELIRLNN